MAHSSAADAIGQILVHALGVAITPIALVAAAALLAAPPTGRRRGAVALAAGWACAAAAVLAIFIAVAAMRGAHRDHGPAGWVPWVRLVLGVLLLVMALQQLRMARSGAEPRIHRRLHGIEAFPAARCLGLGALLLVSNPKNITQIGAAAVTIAAATPGQGDRAGAAAVFLTIASLCVLVPFAVHLGAGAVAGPRLDRWRGWATRNHLAIMAVLFLVLGAKSLGDAISGFATA